LLKLLVQHSVDIVHVSSWEYGLGVRNDYPADSHPTLEILKALPPEITVIGVGGIHEPEQATRVINDGVELVALGRTLLLNANWAIKVREGNSAQLVASVHDESELAKLAIPDNMKNYVRRWFLSQE
jgi:2,4-dienoyl-CoA reductase-like NADH-dependent reductase (Old Yellow Enzyme family)